MRGFPHAPLPAARARARNCRRNKSMSPSLQRFPLELLEPRRMFVFSEYAQLIHQDLAIQNFPQATGAGQTVAIIDSGINYNLTQLGGGIGPGFKVLGGFDFADNDADPMDTLGHGTSVAATVAGTPW